MDARTEEMLKRFKSGETYQSIADIFNISRQRVHQILSEIGVQATEGGFHKQLVEKQRAKQKLVDDRYMDRYGVTQSEYKKLKKKYPSYIQSFRDKRRNCLYRGFTWDINLEEYIKIWKASGKWTKHGSGKGKYCFCRKDINKGYTKNNCEIVPFSEANLRRSTYHDNRNKL